MIHRFSTGFSVLLIVLLIGLLAVTLSMPHALAQTATATVNTSKLNVRSGPGAGYAVIGQVLSGDVVGVMGRNVDASWAHIVTPSGKEGWASTLYLTTTYDFMVLPDHSGNFALEPTAVVTAGSANVRSGPSTSYPILLQVGTGHVMGMLGRNPDGSWVQVRVDGMIGWIAASAIGPQSPIANLPVTSGSVPPPPTPIPVTPPPTATPGATQQPTATGTAPTSQPGVTATPLPNTGVVTADLLNFRSGPGAGYGVIGQLPGGTLVTMLGRNSDGSWLKVRAPSGQVGWVSSLYVSAATPVADLLVLAEAEPQGVVTTDALNVRSGPGANFSVVVTLNQNTWFNLIGRNGNATWVQIRVNGMTGWVDPNFIATDFNIWYLPLGTAS